MNKNDLIKVSARQDGFRRAGCAWHGETIVPLDKFTDDEWEAIKAEPMLIVTEVTTAEVLDGSVEKNTR